MTLTEFVQLNRDSEDYQLFPHLIAKYPLEVSFKDQRQLLDVDELNKWANETFTNDEFVAVAYRFFFRNETCALQFKLVWGGDVHKRST
jgi:hypothetical protein